MLRIINWLMNRHLARREREFEQVIRLMESVRERETRLADEIERWLEDKEED